MTFSVSHMYLLYFPDNRPSDAVPLCFICSVFVIVLFCDVVSCHSNLMFSCHSNLIVFCDFGLSH